jgi:carboxyl-terminal processing protease
MRRLKLRISRKIKIFTAITLLLGSSVMFYAFNDKDFQISKNLDIFVSLFRELNLYYVDDINPEKLIETGINSMLASLDPYTTFIPESKMADFRFMTTGKYGGIGALIRKAGDYSMISEPYKGFPAFNAGLQAGDTIISIDSTSIKGKSISDVSELLKGTPNTQLKLVIKRIGVKEPISKTLTREEVTINNVPYYGMLDDSIGYVRLTSFTKDAANDVKKALLDLKTKNAKSIILDLRGNPGGLLVEAVGVSNLFVPKGQEIVSTKGRVKQWDQTYVTTNPAIDPDIPLVVLVNHGSASASEIVSGSLQDLDRAVIVGQRTFGKGLVQTTRPLSYNTELKVTTAKYYIPSGRCIQALDYSHRNPDGSVGHIPDSLISAFKTKDGRTVYDGGGIKPDITINGETPGAITINLYAKNMLFDFATLYKEKHDSIGPLDKFHLTDADYQDFENFLKSKSFDYTTKSDDTLEDLIKIAKQEKYYTQAKPEFDALKLKLAHNLNKDLTTFKSEIEELLSEEIVSRYYYQTGRIQESLQDDQQLEKAMDVLKSKQLYNSILNGTYTQPQPVVALGK